jgi:hypothetical protein
MKIDPKLIRGKSFSNFQHRTEIGKNLKIFILIKFLKITANNLKPEIFIAFFEV